MNRDLKELFQEAAQLPEGIARRSAGLEAGTVELISWEEVRAELFGRRHDRFSTAPKGR